MASVTKTLFAVAFMSLLLADIGHCKKEDDTADSTEEEGGDKKGFESICRILDSIVKRNQTDAEEIQAIGERVIDWASTSTSSVLENASSVSRTELTGHFKVIVVGTGKACYVKEVQHVGTDVNEEFGEWASSEAFIKFFGQPECNGERCLMTDGLSTLLCRG